MLQQPRRIMKVLFEIFDGRRRPSRIIHMLAYLESLLTSMSGLNDFDDASIYRLVPSSVKMECNSCPVSIISLLSTIRL